MISQLADPTTVVVTTTPQHSDSSVDILLLHNVVVSRLTTNSIMSEDISRRVRVARDTLLPLDEDHDRNRPKEERADHDHSEGDQVHHAAAEECLQSFELLPEELHTKILEFLEQKQRRELRVFRLFRPCVENLERPVLLDFCWRKLQNRRGPSAWLPELYFPDKMRELVRAGEVVLQHPDPRKSYEWCVVEMDTEDEFGKILLTSRRGRGTGVHPRREHLVEEMLNSSSSPQELPLYTSGAPAVGTSSGCTEVQAVGTSSGGAAGSGGAGAGAGENNDDLSPPTNLFFQITRARLIHEYWPQRRLLAERCKDTGSSITFGWLKGSGLVAELELPDASCVNGRGATLVWAYAFAPGYLLGHAPCPMKEDIDFYPLDDYNEGAEGANVCHPLGPRFAELLREDRGNKTPAAARDQPGSDRGLLTTTASASSEQTGPPGVSPSPRSGLLGGSQVEIRNLYLTTGATPGGPPPDPSTSAASAETTSLVEPFDEARLGGFARRHFTDTLNASARLLYAFRKTEWESDWSGKVARERSLVARAQVEQVSEFLERTARVYDIQMGPRPATGPGGPVTPPPPTTGGPPGGAGPSADHPGSSPPTAASAVEPPPGEDPAGASAPPSPPAPVEDRIRATMMLQFESCLLLAALRKPHLDLFELSRQIGDIAANIERSAEWRELADPDAGQPLCEKELLIQLTQCASRVFHGSFYAVTK